MRKNYVKPALISEEFVPQTYVAACEHTESGAGMYKFVCDAGGGASGTLYKETNGIEGLQKNGYCNCGSNHRISWNCKQWVNADSELGGYHACKKAHEAPTTDVFPAGYYVEYGSDTVIPVLLWQGDGDRHATENLNQDTWQKNIS